MGRPAKRQVLVFGIVAMAAVATAGTLAWRRLTPAHATSEDYSRVQYAPEGTYTDAQLLAEARRGNGAAGDRLLLRRSPLLNEVGSVAEGTIYWGRQVPFDVTRDALLRPFTKDQLVETVRQEASSESWNGFSILRLWRVDPVAGRAAALAAARNPKSDWHSGLGDVAWLDRDSLREIGGAYLRSHPVDRDPLYPPDRAIAALDRLPWNLDPSYTSADGYPPLSAPLGPEVERLSEPPEPTTRKEAESWMNEIWRRPWIVRRDPVRTLRIGARAGQSFSAGASLARDYDRLSAPARARLDDHVRGHRAEFAGTMLGYLVLPETRAGWDRRLAGTVATPEMDLLADLWPHLLSRHRERLLDVAASPRLTATASLADRLLAFAPDDPRIRDHGRWALRTPPYGGRPEVIRTLAPHDPEARRLLVGFAADRNPLLRADAAAGLRQPELDPVLAPLVHNESPYVRRQAAIALEGREDPAGRAFLRGLANDPIAAVRDEARARLGVN